MTYKINKISHDSHSGWTNGHKVNFPTVHFSHDFEEVKICTYSLFDVDSQTTIFTNTIEIQPNSIWFTGGGPATINSGNLIFYIFDEEENIVFEEEFYTRGKNRTPIVNGKPIYFKSYLRDKIFQTITEIFYNEDYRNDFVQIDTNDIVVDIGANIGIFSIWALQFSPEKIIAVEPEQTTFNYLQENTKDFNNITIIKKGISDKEGTVELTTTEQSRANYLSINDNILDKNIRTVYDADLISQMVETTTISNLIKENNLERIDFLKVDCEGGELDLFRTIDKKYLRNNIKKISVEFHSKHIKETIVKILSDNGFIFEHVPTDDAPIGMIAAYNNKLFNL